MTAHIAINDVIPCIINRPEAAGLRHTHRRYLPIQSSRIPNRKSHP